MTAHAGGVPVEELLVPLFLGAGAVGAGAFGERVRAAFGHWRRSRRPEPAATHRDAVPQRWEIP